MHNYFRNLLDTRTPMMYKMQAMLVSLVLCVFLPVVLTTMVSPTGNTGSRRKHSSRYSEGKLFGKTSPSQMHNLTVAIKQDNLDVLRSMVEEMADLAPAATQST